MNKHKKQNDLIREGEMVRDEDLFTRMNHNEIYNPSNYTEEHNKFIDCLLEENHKRTMKSFLHHNLRSEDKNYKIQMKFIEKNQKEKRERRVNSPDYDKI